MSLYIKLAPEAMTDPKVLAAGPEGFTLWVKGLLYSKQHTTDGFVPEHALPLLSIGLTEPEKVAARLVDVGLWSLAEGGWTVGFERWSKWQTTKSDIDKKREEWRVRKARSRGGHIKEESVTPKPVTRRSRKSHANVTPPEHRAQSTELTPGVTLPPPQESVSKDQASPGGGDPPPSPQGAIEGELVEDCPPTAMEPQPMQPFDEVSAVLRGVAARMAGAVPPTDNEVRRYLGKTSPVRQMVAKYGLVRAIDIAVYAMAHSPGCGWHRIWEANASFAQQLDRGVASPFRSGGAQTTISEKLAALEGA